MAQPPPLRHQSSMEGILQFSGPQPLATDHRVQVQRRFYAIVEYFEGLEGLDDPSRREFCRPLLLHYTYDYSRSRLSKDTFLRAFFHFMDLDIADEEDVNFDDGNLVQRLDTNLTSFADFLFDHFFMPLKAAGNQTRQPTPAHLSIIKSVQGQTHEFSPTPDRLSVLRGACLVRDHHRCVISRKFNVDEAVRRYKEDANNAQDDEGNLLQGQETAKLEVAHILPHSLTQARADNNLDDSQKAALAILNMFDCDVAHLIDGVNIDRPYNAMSLTHDLHSFFGRFDVYFKAIPDREHTYRIDTFLPPFLLNLPVNRTLYLVHDRSIDPPSPRLLALHCAIAHILNLSGAGEYIDKILGDMEEIGILEDGSSELGRMVQLRLSGWLGGSVDSPA